MTSALEHDPARSGSAPARSGRAPATTPGDISRIALALFFERGFDETTVDEVARAAGIGRRTLFRYFSSKNDLPWGDFDGLLARMEEYLAGAVANEVPVMEALRIAVIEFNRFPGTEARFHRERMRLLLNVPRLVGHSALRYATWRQVIAQFVARRLGEEADALTPQAIAWACLGLCLAAYEQWLASEDADLSDLLSAAFVTLGEAFEAP